MPRHSSLPSPGGPAFPTPASAHAGIPFTWHVVAQSRVGQISSTGILRFDIPWAGFLHPTPRGPSGVSPSPGRAGIFRRDPLRHSAGPSSSVSSQGIEAGIQALQPNVIPSLGGRLPRSQVGSSQPSASQLGWLLLCLPTYRHDRHKQPRLASPMPGRHPRSEISMLHRLIQISATNSRR